MAKQKITEEEKIHEKWFADADKITLENLPEFLRHLMEDYEHDYGTICHALSAGAIATMWAMNNHPQGDITGFQAGGVLWGVIKNWSYRTNKTGLRLIDYDDLLYPQYEYKFDKTISSDTWSLLQKQAQEKLDKDAVDTLGAADSVVNHWKSIVAGVIPFGFKIKD